MLQWIEATTQKDADKLAALAKEIWEEHYTDIIGPDQVAYMLTHLQSADKIFQDINKGNSYVLLQWDQEFVGYISYELQEKALFLSKFYLTAQARGKGIGKKAFHQLLDIAKKEGKQEIILTVNKYNTATIAVYQKLGFYKVRDQVSDIGGGFVMDDYVMALPIQ